MDHGEFLVKHSFDEDLQGVNITFNILQFCSSYSIVTDDKSVKA